MKKLHKAVLYSLQDISKRWGTCDRTTSRRLVQNKIPKIKFNSRMIRYKKSDIDLFEVKLARGVV